MRFTMVCILLLAVAAARSTPATRNTFESEVRPILEKRCQLFVAVPTFAQQPSRSNTVSAFLTDSQLSVSSSSGTRFGTDFGAALDHMFNDRFSAELSVTSQRAIRNVTTFSPAGVPTTISHSGRLYPIDANVSYHFFTEGRWKPYIGAGVRYVSDTVRGSGSLGGYRFTNRTTDGEVSGGITYQFNPRLGLRFDAKQIIGSSRSIIDDPNFKASVGLSLRF
jgi:Outer membrane protein W